ncbi:hypothetical protein SDC9_138108 [bioreactor metagenome]|uniref:Uncharacterized protein n=1 Tax=bioreactor metagenome TaxID=1076179 RepID=A0A645DQJ5_9ZZZZ
MSIRFGVDTAAFDRFKILHNRQVQTLLLRRAADALGDGVFRIAFHSGGQRQSILRFNPIYGFDSHHPKTTFCQCSSFIKDDHVDFAGCF